MRSRILLLLVAASLVLTACGGGSQVVATVADGDLYSFEIDEQLVEELSASSGAVDRTQFAQDLTNTIVELVVIARAESDFDITFTDEEIDTRTDELSTQFAAEIEANGFTDERVRRVAHQQLVADAVQDLLIAREAPITDEDVDAFVNETIRGQTEVCASHILLDTEEDAQAALERVQAGEDFAEVASDVSTGPSGPDGGDLGCALLGNYVAEFAQGAFEAEVGVATDPVQSSFGWHVILVTERTDPDVDVDVVRENAATVLSAQGGQNLVQDWLLGVVTEADVIVEPEYGEWVSSPVPQVTPPA
ncbi:MAG: peptidylprolyl isomerase [Acidimicrobiia bacterium]|nr:peptidylprolyl isomerase [Acidimicrobiia bacterium]